MCENTLRIYIIEELSSLRGITKSKPELGTVCTLLKVAINELKNSNRLEDSKITNHIG